MNPSCVIYVVIYPGPQIVTRSNCHASVSPIDVSGARDPGKNIPTSYHNKSNQIFNAPRAHIGLTAALLAVVPSQYLIAVFNSRNIGHYDLGRSNMDLNVLQKVPPVPVRMPARGNFKDRSAPW